MTTKQRSLKAFTVGTAIALAAISCTAGAAQAPDATLPADPSPTLASPVSESPATGAEIRAERMRLVGNLPGSHGSFAFWGDLAVVNVWEDWPELSPDDGFIVVDVSDPTRPTQLSRFRCIASFADVSIWKDLVFLSQNFATTGDGCDANPTDPEDPEAFAGIRVISIADPEHPVQVVAVPTGIQDASSRRLVWGSHTHTPVPDLDHTDAAGRPAPRILVYSADAGGELYGTEPHGSIVEVPLRDPSSARVVDIIDNGTNAPCHDITVFMPRDLMACSAYEAGVVLFDISDPVHPVRLSHFVNARVVTNQESHHSTTFSNDGNTLVLDAEIFTGVGVTPCAGGTGKPLGALWFYDISDPRAPKRRSYFQLPRANAEHFCYPHESNVVPMSGPRDIVVTGWFGGGVNLIDFTDPSSPREIAFWVRSGLDGEHSFAYAGYWYDGYVYAGNTGLAGIDEPATHRGFDVFAVDHPALRRAIRLPHMNAQTQETPPTTPP